REKSPATLQQVAQLEKPWRERVAHDMRTEKATARKEVVDLRASAKQLQKQIQREIEADRQLVPTLEARLKRRLGGAEIAVAVYRRRQGDAEPALLAALSKGDLHDRTSAIAHCNIARFIIVNKKNVPLAIKLFGEATALDPDFHHALNDRAWLLATHPDAKIRDGKLAVEEALAACEKSAWNDPRCVDTLAAAYAEVGRF